MRWIAVLAVLMLAGCTGQGVQDDDAAVGPPGADGDPSADAGSQEPEEPDVAPEQGAEEPRSEAAPRDPVVTRGEGGSAASAGTPDGERTAVGVLTAFATEFQVPDDAVALVAEMSYQTVASTGAALDLYPPSGPQPTTAGSMPSGEMSGTVRLRIDDPMSGAWKAQGNADGVAVGLTYQLAVTVFFSEPPTDHSAL